jgi:hypothetical protein
MAILQEKSACCGAKVHRIGGKRRRCSVCRRTWSVHKARCGRRRRRGDPDLPRLLLIEHIPARVLSRRRHCSVSTIYRRCRQAVDSSMAGAALSALPTDVDLVMLADGLRFTIRGQGWVQYTIALKPRDDDRAYFADPILMAGSESATNWQAAFTALPPAIVLRIRALVTDGLRGMKEAAAANGWAYQRCHFHVWALLRIWLWPLEYGNNRVIHQAVSDALAAVEPTVAARARAFLRTYVAVYPGGVSGILKQLLRDWAAIRAHIDHPDLCIPTTTNVVESMHNLLRDAACETNTAAGVLRRIAAVIRLHPSFVCNGTSLTQH